MEEHREANGRRIELFESYEQVYVQKKLKAVDQQPTEDQEVRGRQSRRKSPNFLSYGGVMGSNLRNRTPQAKLSRIWRNCLNLTKKIKMSF